MVGLKQEKIENTLRGLGLSAKEVEVFIFLGKRSPLTSGEITKQLKMNRGQVFRLLNKLQKKGLVEATLEFPKRYVVVPFERVIDSFIKSKREEVELIEEIKDELISDWNKISQIELESSLERFSVIEGKKKIFSKISQMLKDTEEEFLCSLDVLDLLKSDQYGTFDWLTKQQVKADVKFKILTESSKQNLKAMKMLNNKFKVAFEFRGTDPTLGSTNFVRMAVRDHKELIIFISEKNQATKDEVILCTNCKSIIEAFSGVFEEAWNKSRRIEDRINEIETGKTSPNTRIIKDPSKAMNKYYQILDSAQDELFLVTSSEGLISLAEDKSKMKRLFDKGIKIKVMSPITSENLGSVQNLMEFCELKHIPLGYLETTIVDNNHLFQFGYKLEEHNLTGRPNFENTFYTDDAHFIKKTKNMLFDIWKKTRTPSSENVRMLAGSIGLQNESSEEHHRVLKKRAFHQNLKHSKSGKISEQDVLDKIDEEKKLAQKDGNNPDNLVRFFGTRAFALIQPPESFHIPKMIIGVFQDDKESCTEGQNYMVIDLYLKMKNEWGFVPVAFIQDTPKQLNVRKKRMEAFPVAKNMRVVEKDHFQVHYNGNTLFVGWTVPITLIESKYVLPPACLLFEGYGKVKSGMFTNRTTFGHTFEIWYNSVDAFVTFFHPQSKYVGSGTEGYIDRESVWISYLPKKPIN